MLDGGLATELERHGANLDDPLWSGKILLESPELLERVNYEYFMAGADVGASASYQITLQGLASKGFSVDQAGSVFRESMAVVRRAAARTGRNQLLIAASIGPYGASLCDGSEFRGDYKLTSYQFKEFHRERLTILAACQPDIVAFETIPNMAEAEALADLLAEFPTLTAWLSFSCRDGRHIADGTPFSAAVKAIAGAQQIEAIGVNCVAPRFVAELLEQASAVTAKPLVAYPNSGECFLPSTRSWGSTNQLAGIGEAAQEWYRRGARLIGGCCRTTPETIKAMRAALAASVVC